MKLQNQDVLRLCRPRWSTWLLTLALSSIGLLGAHINTRVAHAQETAQATTDTQQQNNQLRSFEQVWTTVRDRYWDDSLTGSSWQFIHDEFRPRIESAKSDDQVDMLLNEMLGRLGKSHFGVVPAAAYASLASEKGGNGSIGVELRIIDKQPVVWRMTEDSSARDAGVQTGWILHSVDGQTLESAVDPTDSLLHLPIDRRMLALGLCHQKISLPIGQKKTMEWIDGQGRHVITELEGKVPAGKRALFGNLPAAYVRCDTQMVHDRVPYFALNIFLDPPFVLPQYQAWIQEHRDAPGLILDLRGNPGGMGIMAMSLGGWLVENEGSFLGTMTNRNGAIKFTLQPRNPTFSGKVAILVDELSTSTSEILAGGLQDIHRARILGTRTPGMALPSNLERLPNGSGFQYAFANYTSASGKELEATGVAPDEAVSLTRQSLLQSKDDVIESAAHWIESDR